MNFNSEDLAKKERFTSAFNSIENDMREFQKQENESFAQMLYFDKRSIIKNNQKLLDDWRKLRNLVTHKNSYAIPTLDTIVKIENFANELTKPIRVDSKYLKKVKVLNINTSLAETLTIIKDCNYSQFPVYDDKCYLGLLTENGLIRWLASYVCSEDSIVELQDQKVSVVLEYEEYNNNFQFIPRDMPIRDAANAFSMNFNLEALLITQNGEQKDTLLGIMTRWDVLEHLNNFTQFNI